MASQSEGKSEGSTVVEPCTLHSDWEKTHLILSWTQRDDNGSAAGPRKRSGTLDACMCKALAQVQNGVGMSEVFGEDWGRGSRYSSVGPSPSYSECFLHYNAGIHLVDASDPSQA